MTEVELNMDKMKAREEALRRKEKEIAKKEEQVKDQLEQIRSMRAAMDASMQELEARELVMTDAEAKHGSLLQREEAITRRERDVDSKEETLRERLLEAAKREQEAAEHFKQRQREYEEKLFPLAAREQELVRREMEAQAVDHDLEIKYKQLNKHVAAEEEKEKARDKSLRDREQSLRDQTVLTDRRQQELEQLNIHLTEKQRLLKAEQVENDGRDREIKWREEQLRIGQSELAELKTKLVKWEGKLMVDEENWKLEQSRVALKLADLELRDTELVERTSKLLAVDGETQRREQQTRSAKQAVDELLANAEAERQRLAARREEMNQEGATLTQRDAALRQREEEHAANASRLRSQAKVIEEKEKALKGWIMELQHREQQAIDAAASGSITAPLTSFTANDLAASSFEVIQERYLTMTNKKNVVGGRAAGNGHSKLQPLMPPRSTSQPSDSALSASADVVSLEVKRTQLEETLEEYATLLYSTSDEEKRRWLSVSEESAFHQHELRHRELLSQLHFLWLVLVGKPQPRVQGTAAAARLAKELASFGSQFTAAEWAAYYQVLRTEALRKRSEVIVQSVAKLTEIVDFLNDRVGLEVLQAAKSSRDDLKKNAAGMMRINHRELAKVLPMGRSANPSTILAALSREESPADTNATSDVPREDVRLRQSTSSEQKRTKADEVNKQVAASLPEYLRHHYE